MLGTTGWRDATELAGLVRRREVRSRELVAAALDAIDRLDPAINAVVHRRDEAAMAEADRVDLDAPFAGVPLLVKDGLLEMEGEPYHNGMRVLRDAGWRGREDSWLLGRYRQAGFVVVGRTNLPELATTVTTEPLAYGPTRNPWDLSRTAGGSSGGAAAAVAAGMVPVAHGTDMGGSIRQPAAHCGLVGLKPTRGRTTLGPAFAEYWGPMTHQHVLTRSVRDSAAVLDATAGPGPGELHTPPPPARPWVEELGVEPPRLRVGWQTTARRGSVDPECARAVEVTMRTLEAMGHEIVAVEATPLDDGRLDGTAPVVLAAGVARDVQRCSTLLGREIGLDELEPVNAEFVQAGTAITAGAYLVAVEAVHRWVREVAAWFDRELDLLVTPTVPVPPFPLGEISPDVDVRVQLRRLGELTTFTWPFNLTGQPAISLPLHWTESGLPVGVQLVASSGREDLVFRVASRLEAAMPWHGRHPPAVTA